MYKVLLLGEFSSLHNYLKQGLHHIDDVKVTLASNGDGYKKIGGADMPLPECANRSLIGRLQYYYRFFKAINKLRGFDVVQIINPSVIPYIIGELVVRKLKKNNGNLFLVSGGIDFALVKAYLDGKFDYYVFDAMPEMVSSYSTKSFIGRLRVNYENFLTASVNKVIPILYEYSVGYKHEIISSVVPVPINVAKLEYRDNKPGEKIVFFHGLNDERKKGTKYIKEALERLQKNYSGDVEVIIDGKMPFDKYVNVLSKTNVVVDQCMGYGYGINACISMAQGKVVMAGARPETLNAFGLDECPIINIKPDVDYIYGRLEYIVKNRKMIPEWGRLSRKYVEEVHEMNSIADMYMNIWKNS